MHSRDFCDYLKFRSVSKTYQGQPRPAVADLSFSLDRGEILALVGPSGCGKTTTLRLIAGFERQEEGQICLAGRTISSEDFSLPPEKRNVGLVFQDYALFPHLTVRDNVRFGLTNSKKKDAARIEFIISLVDLAEHSNRYPHELSGGEQQRLALARALAPAPKVLLLDEPFSNLDADLRSQMRNEVKSILLDTGTTAILVTHDQQEAFAFADMVGVLNKGRLEQLDTPERIYHYPATKFAADFVGEADFLIGRIIRPNFVETGIGSFPVRSALPVGTSVEVMLRPDNVGILSAAGESNATVMSRTFRGSINSYRLQLDSGQILHSDQPSSVVFDLAMRVRILPEVDQAVVFPLESGKETHSYTPVSDLPLSGRSEITQRAV